MDGLPLPSLDIKFCICDKEFEVRDALFDDVCYYNEYDGVSLTHRCSIHRLGISICNAVVEYLIIRLGNRTAVVIQQHADVFP